MISRIVLSVFVGMTLLGQVACDNSKKTRKAIREIEAMRKKIYTTVEEAQQAARAADRRARSCDILIGTYVPNGRNSNLLAGIKIDRDQESLYVIWDRDHATSEIYRVGQSSEQDPYTAGCVNGTIYLGNNNESSLKRLRLTQYGLEAFDFKNNVSVYLLKQP